MPCGAYLDKKDVRVLSRPRPSVVKKIWCACAPMLVGYAFLGVLFVRGPTMALAQLSSPTELVRYGIALQFLAVMLSFGNALFFIIGPTIAHLEVGSEEFISMSKALFLLSSIVSVLFTVGNFIFAQLAAVLVFGPKALGIGLMATALSFVGPMQLLMNFRNILTLKTGGFQRQLLALFLSFAFLAVMLWLTVPRYEALGAAVSLSLAHVACAYVACLVVPPMRTLLPDLARCGIGLGGWRDLLKWAQYYLQD